MYLDRGYRSRGIARRMLQRAEARARELGFSKMILSTAEDALRLAERPGLAWLTAVPTMCNFCN
jgi:GNAT superfamily N-acetyltransferase